MKQFDLAIFTVFLCLVAGCQSQKLCTDCWQNNTFLCNSQNCESFSTNNGQIMSCNYVSVKCRQRYSTNFNCYYYAPPNKCVACNYTFPGCNQCYDIQKGCDICDFGYYSYRDLASNLNVCKSCAVNIPGCQLCSAQSKCTQCKPEYRTINGLCYNQDGTLVNQSESNISTAWSQQGIASLVILCLIMVIMSLGFFFGIKYIRKLIANKSLLTTKEQY